MSDQLSVVLNGLLVVASGRAELGHLAKTRDRLDVPVLVSHLLLLLLDLHEVGVEDVLDVGSVGCSSWNLIVLHELNHVTAWLLTHYSSLVLIGHLLSCEHV